MSDKLTKKKKSSRSSGLMSFKDDEDFRESDDKVTYVSTNKKTGTEFIGSAPPNSRLAATLAQVAVAVQADNLPRYKEGPARLTSSASPRRQLQAGPAWTSAPAAAPGPGFYRDERDDYRSRGYTTEYRDDQEDYKRTPGVNEVREQNYPRSQQDSAYSPPIVSARHPDERLTEGTRYELDQKVAYHSNNANGEIYVSAPTGSNEAQLFDEMARRMSKSGEHRSSSKGKEKYNTSKSRGWFLGW